MKEEAEIVSYLASNFDTDSKEESKDTLKAISVLVVALSN